MDNTNGGRLLIGGKDICQCLRGFVQHVCIFLHLFFLLKISIDQDIEFTDRLELEAILPNDSLPVFRYSRTQYDKPFQQYRSISSCRWSVLRNSSCMIPSACRSSAVHLPKGQKSAHATNRETVTRYTTLHGHCHVCSKSFR